MRVVVQRVEKAHVEVKNKTVGKIDNGLLLLVGFTHTDTEKEINWMVNKVINLRIFDDENGIMNLSVQDVKGDILSVSQFTLYGDATKGNRPSYLKALNGDKAIELYELFNKKLREKNIKVETGVFGGYMDVSFTNVGPTTILLEK
jgi:D-tyrosyl-tRNA(Tyr) deacylase